MEVRANTSGVLASPAPEQDQHQKANAATSAQAAQTQASETSPATDDTAASRMRQPSASTLDLLRQQTGASNTAPNPRAQSETLTSGTTFDFTKKSEYQSDIDFLKSQLPSIAAGDTSTTPFALSDSREGAGFSGSYLRAHDRLKALSTDQRVIDMAAMTKANAQDLRVTIDGNGNGKLEARSTTTSDGAYVTLQEAKVSRDSTDLIQTAFRAANQAGGAVRFSDGKPAFASARDLLTFYGVQPNDPKTSSERTLAKHAVEALTATFKNAASRTQWGIQADLNNLTGNVKYETTDEQYVSPSQWSPLGQEIAAGRTALGELVESDAFFEKTAALTGSSQHSLSATVDKDGTLTVQQAYLDTDGTRKNKTRTYPNPSSSVSQPNAELIQSVRDRTQNLGGNIRSAGDIEIGKALKYYGISSLDLSTSQGRSAAADEIKELRSEYMMGNKGGSIRIDDLLTPDDQVAILREVRDYMGEKDTSLLDKLGKDVIANASEDALSKTPAYFLHRILRGDEATQLTNRLLEKLDWVGPKDNDSVSSELQAQLLQKAIALQLEADADKSGNSAHTLGYPFDQPDNEGKTYKEIGSDFERHLLKEGLASSRNSAILTARAYKGSLPAEFAVPDVPPDMRYKTSLAWVKFAHGINIAENLQPDAFRGMTFGEVVDLPDQMSMKLAKHSEQATSESERQGVQRAKDALDLLKLGPVGEWAKARGMPLADKNGKTLSQDELNTAVANYEMTARELVQSYEALSRPLSTRAEMADAELKAAGIDPDLELRYRRQTTTGKNGGKKFFEYVATTPRDIYMSGEIKTFGFGVEMRDAKSNWVPFNNTSSNAIQGLPDINKAFQEKFDTELQEKQQAYQVVVKNLLETIPRKDRQAIDDWGVKVFSVSGPDDIDNDAPGPLGGNGFLLEAKKNQNEKFSYEIFPEAGHIRRAVTDTWVDRYPATAQTASPPNSRAPKSGRSLSVPMTVPVSLESYSAGLEWDAYSHGGIPGHGMLKPTILNNIDQYPTSSPEVTGDENRQRTNRENGITHTVATKIFLAKSEQFHLAAKGQSNREAELSSRLDLLDTLSGFIPFYGSAKDLQSDKLSDRIMGGAGLFLDIVTLGLPIGRLFTGGLRAGKLAITGSWNAAQQTLSSTVKKYGPGILSEALVLPDLAQTSIQVAKGTGSLVRAGLRQLRGTTEVLTHADGFSNVADPRSWKPARTGDSLRTLEGVDNVQVRNVGTADKPEFARINPTTGATVGGRYIDVAGDLRRKPDLKGYEATLAPSDIDQMSPRGNGVWDHTGKQYVSIDGKYYESTFANGERYVKHPTYLGDKYQIERISDDRWLPLPRGGLGGMKRTHASGSDIGESGAKQLKHADQPHAWSEAQLSTYRAKLKTYGQTDGAVDKIFKAANENRLTPAQRKYHEAGVQAVRDMPAPASTSTSSMSRPAGQIDAQPAQTTSSASTSVRTPEPGMPQALARMRLVPRDQWPQHLYHYTSEHNFSQMRGDNVLNYSVIDWHTPIKPMGAFMTPIPPNGNTLRDISKSIFPANFQFEQYRENGVARYFKFDTSKMPGEYTIYKSDTPGSNEYFVKGTPNEVMGLVHSGSILGKPQNYLVESGDTITKGGARTSK